MRTYTSYITAVSKKGITVKIEVKTKPEESFNQLTNN